MKMIDLAEGDLTSIAHIQTMSMASLAYHTSYGKLEPIRFPVEWLLRTKKLRIEMS